MYILTKVKMTKLSFPEFKSSNLHSMICRWPQQEYRIHQRPEYKIRPFRFHLTILAKHSKKRPNRPVTWNVSSYDFYPMPVLTFGYCRRPRRSLCVRAKHIKTSVYFMVDWPWPSRSNLTLESDIASFGVCPHDSSSPIHDWTAKFG